MGKPTQFIQTVSLSGKQIFPQLQFDTISSEIPLATFRNGKFSFTSNQSCEYSFTTNSNQLFKRHLEQAKVAEIENFKGKIEFFPISDEVISPLVITKLKSFTEFDNPAIKYFAGKARYTLTFSAPNGFDSANDSIALNSIWKREKSIHYMANCRNSEQKYAFETFGINGAVEIDQIHKITI